MSELTFFTPCYRGDFERFALLRESIRRFYRGKARHVVVVPKKDISVFSNLVQNDRNIELLSEQDFVEPYFYPPKWYSVINKVAPSQSWRFSAYAGRPGWIIQQIVKLCLPDIIPKGPVAILDSDVVFIHSFKDSDLGVSSSNRILICHEQSVHKKHIEKARLILNLPSGNTDHHYMSYPCILYPDWILELRSYLEKIYPTPWQNTLYESDGFSEYSLYGVFVEEILKPNKLVIRKEPFHYCILDEASFKQFFSGDWKSMNGNRIDEPICLLVQSNLKIPVSEYASKLRTFWDIHTN